MRPLPPLDRAALIINECQLAMVDGTVSNNAPLVEQVEQRAMVSRIATLAAAFRAVGRPVVHSTIVPRPGYVGFTANCLLLGSLKKSGLVVEGHPGAQIHPALAPQDGDLLLQRRHGVTGFHGTELDPTLRALGVDTVVITGVSTNIGVPGLCLDAVNRGLQAIVPEDCTAGAWAEAHEFQVRHTLPLLATVTTSAQVIAALGDGA